MAVAAGTVLHCLPQKAGCLRFTSSVPPPVQVFNNLNPKLPMEPTIVAPPDVNMPNVNMAQYGDPLAKIGPPSTVQVPEVVSVPDRAAALAPAKVPDSDPGEGGGFGGGVFRVGGGVTAPVPLFRPEPEYSEEARKAKYQGTVVLYVEVDASGQPRNLKVVRSLGLGLDEKAIEAVEKWKFRPGYKDGKPVTVAATVEVNFRLLTVPYCLVAVQVPSPSSPMSNFPFIFLSLSTVPL